MAHRLGFAGFRGVGPNERIDLAAREPEIDDRAAEQVDRNAYMLILELEIWPRLRGGGPGGGERGAEGEGLAAGHGFFSLSDADSRPMRQAQESSPATIPARRPEMGRQCRDASLG